jgi:hypothetical protein
MSRSDQASPGSPCEPAAFVRFEYCARARARLFVRGEKDRAEINAR